MRRKGGQRAGTRSCRLEVGSLGIVGSRCVLGGRELRRPGYRCWSLSLLCVFSLLCDFYHFIHFTQMYMCWHIHAMPINIQMLSLYHRKLLVLDQFLSAEMSNHMAQIKCVPVFATFFSFFIFDGAGSLLPCMGLLWLHRAGATL